MLKLATALSRNFARKTKPLSPKFSPKPAIDSSTQSNNAIEPSDNDTFDKIDRYRELGYEPHQITSLIEKTSHSANIATIDKIIAYTRRQPSTDDKFIKEIEEINEIDKIVGNSKTKMHHSKQKGLKASEKAYESLINEVIDGNSLSPPNSLKESFSSRIAKKFTSDQLEQAREERKKLLEKRGETETYLKVFENKDLRVVTPEELKVQKDRLFRPDELKNNMESLLEMPMNEIVELGLAKKQLKALMELRAEKIAQITGDDLEDVLSDLKAEFFQAKKLEEENAKFESNMKKRERRKEIKDMLNRLSKNEFKSVDMEPEDIESVEKVKYKYDDTEVNESQEKIKQETSRKLAQQLYGLKDDEIEMETFDIVKIRTSKNFQRFFNHFFDPLRNKGLPITKNETIVVDEVFISRNMHIAYVFWDLADETDELDETANKLKRDINESLNKASKRIASIMLRDLGLSKPPVIYFFVSKLTTMNNKLLADYESGLKDMIVDELRETLPDKYELLVKKNELDKYLEEKKEQVMVKSSENVSNFVSNAPFVKGLLKEMRHKQCGHVDKGNDLNGGGDREKNKEGEREKKKMKKKKTKVAPEVEFWNKIMKGSVI